LYVILVGSFLFYGSELKLGQTKTIFAPIAMLMLLVFSAALTGALIFGRPILWYLEGKRTEALQLLMYTLAILFCITLVALATVATVVQTNRAGM